MAVVLKVACNYSCVEIELQLLSSSKKHLYRDCWPNSFSEFRNGPSFKHARMVDYDAYGATKDYDSETRTFLALVAIALIGSACSCACVAISALKRRKILVEPRHELISFVRREHVQAEQDVEMSLISPPSMSNPVGHEEDTSHDSPESAQLQIEPVDVHPQDVGAAVQTDPEDKE
ncbi:unnamed protein product [Heligmosomoides polygyrus]|uniref:Tyrosine-protein phosphatase domain-containing protein n=1 Tax=Heligmosomoides polygyrus TaxID=6339 RepID=A0A3P8DX13_HELPZ|nr:unnamed protein product [Heligmosomoides polygyrus]